MLFKCQHYDDGRCDGCGRRTAIAEVVRTEVSHELDFCKSCFHELAVRLFHAAAQLRLETIKHRIGGFDDEKLRQVLVQAGAVRFEGPVPKREDLWGLIDRNRKNL